ncbi:mediator of RNA polymerase II transcription subunit 15 [Galendromus occidentalis]|uniref:Mediator of RNA polymerase II transcription subunit 15 n=1 Tax=Galendromus occidentalis TaxID=34638 RepID=A0AAJ7L5D9_9ACAR|nr:mediator of RNA polymerase II transcription subunit 15 [Galendromus occidentalis]
MMMNQGQGNPMMVQQMGQRPPLSGPGGVGPPQQGMMVMGPQQGKMRPQMPSQQPPNAIPNQGAVPSPMGSSMANQMTPSPAAYAHSPSGGVVPSPVGVAASGGYLRQGQVGAPSPGSALNTPINSVASPASGPLVGSHGHQSAGGTPVSRNAEDQAYLEKLKYLNKYIDPLRRMIARIDKDEDRKKELSKLKSLLDILSDPNRRCSMDTLVKCEQVLERLDLRVRNPDQTMIGHVPSVTSMTRLQNDNLWQPLLDAINANIKSPMFNHTLQRVFGQPITMLLGAAYSQNSTPPSSPPTKRRCVSSAVEEMYEVSDVLQNEIAHLDQRFKVQLDPVQQFGNKTIKLICQLDDKALPSVPPITVTVPENYPESPPLYSANKVQYASTNFYDSVLNALKVHMDKMPSQFSVTALLDTWEMCVRQTCSSILPSLKSPAKA